jgi:hypothetical protein
LGDWGDNPNQKFKGKGKSGGVTDGYLNKSSTTKKANSKPASSSITPAPLAPNTINLVYHGNVTSTLNGVTTSSASGVSGTYNPNPNVSGNFAINSGNLTTTANVTGFNPHGGCLPVTSASAGVAANILSAEGEMKYTANDGSKSATIKGEGKWISGEANASINTARGFQIKAEAGACIAKGEISGVVKAYGGQVTGTIGVAAGTADIGGALGIYRTDSTLNFEGLFHMGFGLGVSGKVDFIIPTR